VTPEPFEYPEYKKDHHHTLMHAGRSFGSVNFLTGGGEEIVTDREKKFRVHGVLMAISWGLLVPSAIVIARFFKHMVTAHSLILYLSSPHLCLE